MSMAQTVATIELSRRAFLYFAGYYAWQFFRKLVFIVLIIMVAITAYRLIGSAQVFGMADTEIAKAFTAPLPKVAGVFFIFTCVYAIFRAGIATKTTKYTLTRKGLIVETGGWSHKTTVVDYAQIQKMTIVTNPFDRIFHARYIYLDMIGGGSGVILEAVDAEAVDTIQARLTTISPALISQPKTKSQTPKISKVKTKPKSGSKTLTKKPVKSPSSKSKSKPPAKRPSHRAQVKR